jgi:hypothetical protein
VHDLLDQEELAIGIRSGDLEAQRADSHSAVLTIPIAALGNSLPA